MTKLKPRALQLGTHNLFFGTLTPTRCYKEAFEERLTAQTDDRKITLAFPSGPEKKNTLQIHASVLEEASKPLNALISLPFMESRTSVVTMPEESFVTFCFIHKYLYCKTIELNNAPADLPLAADRWALDGLFDACFAYLEVRNWKSVEELMDVCLPLMRLVQAPASFHRSFTTKMGRGLEHEILPWVRVEGEQERLAALRRKLLQHAARLREAPAQLTVQPDKLNEVVENGHSEKGNQPCGEVEGAPSRTSNVQDMSGANHECKIEQTDPATTPFKDHRQTVSAEKDFASDAAAQQALSCMDNNITPNASQNPGAQQAACESGGMKRNREDIARERQTILWTALHTQHMLTEAIEQITLYAEDTEVHATFVLGGVLRVLGKELTTAEKIELLARLAWRRKCLADVLKNPATETWSVEDWRIVAQAQARAAALWEGGGEEIDLSIHWSDLAAHAHNSGTFLSGKVECDEFGSFGQYSFCLTARTYAVQEGVFNPLFLIFSALDHENGNHVAGADQRRALVSVDVADDGCPCEGPERRRFKLEGHPWGSELTLKDWATGNHGVCTVFDGSEFEEWCGKHQPWCGLTFRVRVRICEEKGKDEASSGVNDRKSKRGICACGGCADVEAEGAVPYLDDDEEESDEDEGESDEMTEDIESDDGENNSEGSEDAGNGVEDEHKIDESAISEALWQ